MTIIRCQSTSSPSDINTENHTAYKTTTAITSNQRNNFYGNFFRQLEKKNRKKTYEKKWNKCIKFINDCFFSAPSSGTGTESIRYLCYRLNAIHQFTRRYHRVLSTPTPATILTKLTDTCCLNRTQNPFTDDRF